jgi:peroxiredoxin Q/BCP
VGASPDPVKAQARFKEKHDLPYPLLSDSDHALADAYGCWVEKSMYGRTYEGVERSTFLVDAEGVVRHVWRQVKVKGHVTEVLEAVEAL